MIFPLLAVGISALSLSAFAQDVGKGTDATQLGQVGYCQLPGVITKFSQSATYPMPGKVIRASMKDCKIRGGRYRATPDEATITSPRPAHDPG